MSNDIEKLKFIEEKVDDLLSFREKFVTIENLLNDKMGFDASLMCLLQIGETLHKLKDSPYAELLPIKGSYDVRNFIAHDYEGVNKAIVEDIIRFHIPDLKRILLELIEMNS
jgi:uncharacterized protein with HEPN domain